MTTDTDALSEQMRRCRHRGGQFERLESGRWVPWPVLTIDRIGRKEAERAATNGRRRETRA
jgi:hypothetical protein